MRTGVDHYDQITGGSFDAGQSMLSDSFRLCLSRFLFHCGQPLPKTVLDLGSGTGRFCPDLAEAFGGHVFGVEPSDSMRSYAHKHRPHARVTYKKGRAESIPLGDASCDLAILHEMVHHVPDRAAMAAELARVLKPGGRAIIGTRVRDQDSPPVWAKYFPQAYELLKPRLPTIPELRAVLEPAGFAYLTHEVFDLHVAPTLKAYRERLSYLAISALAQLSAAELSHGFTLLDSEIANDHDSGPVRAPIYLLVVQRQIPSGAIGD
jgi:ubiquinone/menaquinone biosynthesis C-methylase UbiE